MRRQFFVRLLAFGLIAVVPVTVHGQPEATTYQFGVFYGDKRIGEHVYEVVQDRNATRVQSRADFQVKLLFVTAYRYRHRANELWEDGCLTGLSSVTDDNGDSFRVEAERREARLQLTSLEPETERVTLATDCPASYAYWDRSRLDRAALINAQTGDVEPARLIREGRDNLDGAATVRYRLETEGVPPITLWYREHDDAWIRLKTRRDGTALTYRLESLTRRAASAIQQDAGVEDPPGV